MIVNCCPLLSKFGLWIDIVLPGNQGNNEQGCFSFNVLKVDRRKGLVCSLINLLTIWDDQTNHFQIKKVCIFFKQKYLDYFSLKNKSWEKVECGKWGVGAGWLFLPKLWFDWEPKLDKPFFYIHLGYSFNFTVVYICQSWGAYHRLAEV